MKTTEFIAEIRIDANDINKNRWEDAIIIAYMNNGMAEIFNVRPDIFETNMDVKLKYGGIQNICCCTDVRKVNFISDGNGTKVADIRQTDINASSFFGKKNCVGGNRNYSVISNQSINVNPPVGLNENVWLNITCTKAPEPFTSASNYADITHETKNALKMWVLWELHKSEQESQTSTSQSRFYLQNFYSLLGIKKQIKDNYDQPSRVLQNKVLQT